MSTLKVPQRSFYFASASYLVQMHVVLDVAGDCECDVDCINVERQSHTHTHLCPEEVSRKTVMEILSVCSHTQISVV